MKQLSAVMILILTLFAPAAGLAEKAEDAVSITVRPSVATGGNARVQVLVSRHEMNRALVWEIDGPNYYRLSSRELHGATSPRSHLFLVRGLPPGTFEVRATVRRNDNSRFVDRSTLLVTKRVD